LRRVPFGLVFVQVARAIVRFSERLAGGLPVNRIVEVIEPVRGRSGFGTQVTVFPLPIPFCRPVCVSGMKARIDICVSRSEGAGEGAAESVAARFRLTVMRYWRSFRSYSRPRF